MMLASCLGPAPYHRRRWGPAPCSHWNMGPHGFCSYLCLLFTAAVGAGRSRCILSFYYARDKKPGVRHQLCLIFFSFFAVVFFFPRFKPRIAFSLEGVQPVTQPKPFIPCMGPRRIPCPVGPRFRSG